MSAGGKEKSGSPAPPEAPPPESDALLTSDDLFGEFVDGPLPPAQGGGSKRTDPIRVQVSGVEIHVPVRKGGAAIPGRHLFGPAQGLTSHLDPFVHAGEVVLCKSPIQVTVPAA